jgi:glycosyltransferase involved in cell wall biosynthesis
MFQQVVAEHPRARLVVVGDGSLRTELTSLSQSLGVHDACRWLGHRDDLVELYQVFDVLVQSSETEGTPNAILEAMATETPIVATDVGGTTELARPGIDGLIVPNHDVAALKAAVDSVRLDRKGALARSTSARQRVEAELSFVARTRRLERLYHRLALEHGILQKGPAPTDGLGRAW